MRDDNVRVIKLKLFKYWPSKALRSAWREYVFQEAADLNILALGVAVRILERVNAEFLQRQIDNQIKKQRQQHNAMIAAATTASAKQGKQ